MNKTFFSEFSESIGSEDSFWHDVNLQISSEILTNFTAQDWSEMSTAIHTKPAYWQERCAESIGYLENPEGVDILRSLLNSPYNTAAAVAASELDNMNDSLPSSYKRRLLDILRYLTEIKSSRCDDINRLIDRLE